MSSGAKAPISLFGVFLCFFIIGFATPTFLPAPSSVSMLEPPPHVRLFSNLGRGRDEEEMLVHELLKFQQNGRRWSSNPSKSECFIHSNFSCTPIFDPNLDPEWMGGCAPSFIIFGASKSGTTSLYEYLAAHPQVGRAISGIFHKEVRYFSEFMIKGVAWYLHQFPPIKPSSVLVSGYQNSLRVMSGEASPTYFFEKKAPARIKELMGNVKLILILREPVTRMMSYVKMLKGIGSFSKGKSFAELVDQQISNLRGCYQTDHDDVPLSMQIEKYQKCFLEPATIGESEKFLLESIYYFQMENWLTYFQRSQILVLKFEDFFSMEQKEKNMKKVAEFLGLCPIEWGPIISKVWNERKEENPSTTISEAEMRRFKSFFKPFNDKLGKILQMDFSEWN